MAYSIVGIKWRDYIAFRHGSAYEPVVEQVSELNNIKPTIQSLLFDRKCHQVLTKYNNELFICEKTDNNKRLYVWTKIDYHPYNHLV